MRKITTEEFIKKARLIHEIKYDYSFVDYIDCETKIKIVCPIHGEFEQTPYVHNNLKANCPKCSAVERSNRLGLDFLKNKFKNMNFDFVNDYKNNEQELKLVCKDCGNIFYRTAKELQKGRKCYFCSSGNKATKETFIWKARKIHGDKYDYSLVNYSNAKTPVKIYCNKCKKIFLQKPDVHLNGSGCYWCSNNHKLTTEKFVEKAKQIHGDKYDYKETNYLNMKTSIKIYCNKCKDFFWQKPWIHLSGCGCPNCLHYILEEKVYNELISKGLKKDIDFFTHYSFPDLRDAGLLSYDFFIPSEKILIECNGSQHYKQNTFFQPTLHDFHKQLHHDWLKRKYAIKNGYILKIVKQQ